MFCHKHVTLLTKLFMALIFISLFTDKQSNEKRNKCVQITYSIEDMILVLLKQILIEFK